MRYQRKGNKPRHISLFKMESLVSFGCSTLKVWTKRKRNRRLVTQKKNVFVIIVSIKKTMKWQPFLSVKTGFSRLVTKCLSVESATNGQSIGAAPVSTHSRVINWKQSSTKWTIEKVLKNASRKTEKQGKAPSFKIKENKRKADTQAKSLPSQFKITPRVSAF